MGKFVYPYAPFALPSTFPLPPNPPIDRPILTARLELSGGPYCNILALADSGADVCLFSLRMARSLGLNLGRHAEVCNHGARGALNTSHITPPSQSTSAAALRFETLAGFTKGMDSAGFGLLGQQGFFENYNVEFRRRDGIFTIESSSNSYRATDSVRVII